MVTGWADDPSSELNARAASRLMSQIATRWPRATDSLAAAAPIPLAAPVITTVLGVAELVDLVRFSGLDMAGRITKSDDLIKCPDQLT